MSGISQAVSSADLVSEFAWSDCNNEGGRYQRNKVTKLQENAAFPEELAEVPWGHGVSLFDLGKQSAFRAELSASQQSQDLNAVLNTIADSIAASLPANAGRNCRVQLGLQDNPDEPAMHSGSGESVMLAVWGSDPETEHNSRTHIKNTIKLKDERGELLTAGNLHASRLAIKADAASRLYRRKLAYGALQSLQAGFDITVPAHLESQEEGVIFDSVSCDLVSLRPTATTRCL